MFDISHGQGQDRPGALDDVANLRRSCANPGQPPIKQFEGRVVRPFQHVARALPPHYAREHRNVVVAVRALGAEIKRQGSGQPADRSWTISA
jgi:hypothetical protein